VATLTTYQIGIGGAQATYVAAAGGGDAVAADDRTFVNVINGGGAPITVTVVIPGTLYGVAIADPTVTIANGANKDIGPLIPAMADPTTGLVSLTYSAVTSVTIAAKRC
jgi:hypothetical protein